MEHSNIFTSKYAILLAGCLTLMALFFFSVSGQGGSAALVFLAAPANRSSPLPAVSSPLPVQSPDPDQLHAIPQENSPAAFSGTTTARNPQIAAESYLVQFIDDTEPLLNKKEWKHMRPASITKLMTADIAAMELPSGTSIPFSDTAVSVEEKTSHAPAGESFALNDALKMMLVTSANDAALALSEAVGRRQGTFDFTGSVGLFISLMNAEAQKLGMRETVFKNPTGLDDPQHYTTAQDLFILASHIWQTQPLMWSWTREREIAVISESGKQYPIVSTNTLLDTYPAILAGKTGYTDEAKGTLLFLYPVKRVQNRQIAQRIAVIVILGSDDRFGDGERIIKWLEETNVQ